MFERYTEKARRVIFFGRYEAGQCGSEYIETEHLLLGLLREDTALAFRLLRPGSTEAIREQLQNRTTKRSARTTSVDLPLSNECKRILAYAADEAERLQHKHIGTEHLLLGILCEKKCFAAEILHGEGMNLKKVRIQVSDLARQGFLDKREIVVHGTRLNADNVSRIANECRKFWWQKRDFGASDIVFHLSDRRISFDTTLAADSTAFELIKGGWKHAACKICSWVLKESDDHERGTGYTNGRHWLCCECYEKFVAPNPQGNPATT